MSTTQNLNVAIIGVLGRGWSFLKGIKSFDNVNLVAVCDIKTDALKIFYTQYGNTDLKIYSDYNEMIEKESLDVVFIATPINLHVEQSIEALARDITVISEVTAALSIEEAKRLVEACKKSKGKYMMAENCNYFKPALIINQMVKSGKFGEVTFAEADYVHDVKALSEKTLWRKKYMYSSNGIVYGTHSLGPIMQWFDWDRITELTCRGSGSHFADIDGIRYNTEDTCVMLGKTKKGRLIKIKNDFVSPRPGINQYTLQGTEGAFISKRCDFDKDLVYFTEQSQHGWTDIEEFSMLYFEERFRRLEETANGQGHFGADFYMVVDIISAILEDREMPIDIHKSLDLTLPGLISKESIDNGGVWLKVPDSREW